MLLYRKETVFFSDIQGQQSKNKKDPILPANEREARSVLQLHHPIPALYEFSQQSGPWGFV
jgi:hypothetical protein